MNGVAHAQCLALYNRWQNRSLYGCADRLSDEERRRERGAFFGSIHKTLGHVLWADRLWFYRFGAGPSPEASFEESRLVLLDWAELRRQRAEMDAAIIDWAATLDTAWLAGEHRYFQSNTGLTLGKPRWELVTHFFNHQTHHRGQVHCLLTQAGQMPDDTDLPMMPE